MINDRTADERKNHESARFFQEAGIFCLKGRDDKTKGRKLENTVWGP